jgi:hypothetical protein
MFILGFYYPLEGSRALCLGRDPGFGDSSYREEYSTFQVFFIYTVVLEVKCLHF